MNSSGAGRENWSESTAMGTTVHICLVEDPAAPSGVGGEVRPLHALVAEVDAALSRFLPTSDVGRLNDAPGRWMPVGRHLAVVAEAAARYREFTGGVFDPVTGDAERELELRSDGDGWVARISPGCRLDFGAIAKGYAADLVRGRARTPGVLVSLGTSSIAVSGLAPRHGGWRIAIGSPWEALPETLGYLEVAGGSFSMSGAYGRRPGSTDVVVAHVRDPRTGVSARTDLCAVGVLSDDGMRSEALSTACLVLGLDEGMDLCARVGVDALFLVASGRIVASPGMAPRISLRSGVTERLRSLRRI